MDGSPTKKRRILTGWDESDEEEVREEEVREEEVREGEVHGVPSSGAAPSAGLTTAIVDWMSDCEEDDDSDVPCEDQSAIHTNAGLSTPTPNTFNRGMEFEPLPKTETAKDASGVCLVPTGFASNFDASGRAASEHVIMDQNGSIMSTGGMNETTEKATLEIIQIPPSPSRDATTEIQRSQMKQAKDSIEASENLGRRLLVNDVKRMQQDTWSVLDIVTQGLDKRSSQVLREQASDGLMTNHSHPEISEQLQRWMASPDESLKRTAQFLYRSLFMPTNEVEDFNVQFLDSLDSTCYIKPGEHLDYVIRLLRKHGAKKNGKGGSLVTTSTALHNGVLIPRTRTLFQQLARTPAKGEDKKLCPNGVEHCAAMNWLNPSFPSLPIADFCVKQAFKLDEDVPCVFCQLRSSLETSIIFQMTKIPVPCSKLTMSSYVSLCWGGEDGFSEEYAFISNMPSGICGPSLTQDQAFKLSAVSPSHLLYHQHPIVEEIDNEGGEQPQNEWRDRFETKIMTDVMGEVQTLKLDASYFKLIAVPLDRAIAEVPLQHAEDRVRTLCKYKDFQCMAENAYGSHYVVTYILARMLLLLEIELSMSFSSELKQAASMSLDCYIPLYLTLIQKPVTEEEDILRLCPTPYHALQFQDCPLYTKQCKAVSLEMNENVIQNASIITLLIMASWPQNTLKVTDLLAEITEDGARFVLWCLLAQSLNLLENGEQRTAFKARALIYSELVYGECESKTMVAKIREYGMKNKIILLAAIREYYMHGCVERVFGLKRAMTMCTKSSKGWERLSRHTQYVSDYIRKYTTGPWTTDSFSKDTCTRSNFSASSTLGSFHLWNFELNLCLGWLPTSRAKSYRNSTSLAKKMEPINISSLYMSSMGNLIREVLALIPPSVYIEPWFLLCDANVNPQVIDTFVHAMRTSSFVGTQKIVKNAYKSCLFTDTRTAGLIYLFVHFRNLQQQSLCVSWGERLWSQQRDALIRTSGFTGEEQINKHQWSLYFCSCCNKVCDPSYTKKQQQSNPAVTTAHARSRRGGSELGVAVKKEYGNNITKKKEREMKNRFFACGVHGCLLQDLEVKTCSGSTSRRVHKHRRNGETVADDGVRVVSHSEQVNLMCKHTRLEEIDLRGSHFYLQGNSYCLCTRCGSIMVINAEYSYVGHGTLCQHCRMYPHLLVTGTTPCYLCKNSITHTKGHKKVNSLFIEGEDRRLCASCFNAVKRDAQNSGNLSRQHASQIQTPPVKQYFTLHQKNCALLCISLLQSLHDE